MVMGWLTAVVDGFSARHRDRRGSGGDAGSATLQDVAADSKANPRCCGAGVSKPEQSAAATAFVARPTVVKAPAHSRLWIAEEKKVTTRHLQFVRIGRSVV